MPRHNVHAIQDLKANLLARLALHNPDLAQQIQAVRLEWYRVANQASEDNPTNTDVFIYDEIGGSMGVDAATFAEELNAITTPQITVRINSPGGSLFDGIAIYNTLVQHRSTVRTRVDGIAASAASIIAMAASPYNAKADTGGVEMMLGSQLMIHDASAAMAGNAADMAAMSEFLNRQSNNITGIYVRKAGGTAEDWRDKMLAETWFFADEAVAIGLADRVYTPPKDGADGEQGSESAPADLVEAVEDAFQDIEILMHRRFDMSAKDYKYPDREHAPEPVLSKKVDVRLYAEAFAAALARKVK